MAHSHVNLKDPKFAALLAFLVPGLGHFYQRRVFKGVLYSVCILGTFFAGMRIGHGQVVYFNWQTSETRTYAYLCQFWVGLPAIPALAQSQLRTSEAFDSNYVPHHFEARFTGILADAESYDGKVTGQLALQPQQPDTPRLWGGKLVGTLVTEAGPVKVEGEVTPGSLDPEVAPSSKRRLVGTFQGRAEGRPDELIRGRIEGDIPRSFWNSYEAPLRDVRLNEFANDQTDLDRAHFELGSRFELGVVFTMIAGLLNVLAIYDALEGPAYDGEEDDEKAAQPPAVPEPPAA